MVALKPMSPGAHNNLGVALAGKGEVATAIAEFRAAVRLKSDYAEAHCNLGVALAIMGDLDAIAEFRAAVRINPEFAEARYNLADALTIEGEADAAITEYREAVRINPDFAEAYCNLGLALGSLRSYAEALPILERGHELGSRQPGWRYPSDQWVLECRRKAELEARLPAIFKGQESLRDTDERLTLAGLCSARKLHASSARFYGEAFDERPALGDNLAAGNRYNAACAASLAGSGMGKDDPAPDEAARIKLRDRARDWLRADLAAWSTLREGGNPQILQAIAPTLAHWREDSDLAGIRDPEALAKLPGAEREAFRSLWADVEALRLKAGGK